MQKHLHLSRLETIPGDILQHIAFLSALYSCLCSDTGSSAGAPRRCACTPAPTALFRLLQTSSTIYRQLSFAALPELYADLFLATFDTQALARRYTTGTNAPPVHLTSSALGAEFVNRCRLLRRVRCGDASPRGLMQDLWAALWMLLESDGANEVCLSMAGFSSFIISLARSHLDPCLHPHLRKPSDSDGQHLQSHSHSSHIHNLHVIIIWLLCLSVHKDVILGMHKYDRDALVRCMFPFMFGQDKANTPSMEWEAERQEHHRSQCALDGGVGGLQYPAMSASDVQDIVTVYGVQSRPFVPDPTSAAIQLVFALEEAGISLQIPPHLPETRSIANATLRTGPTKEDFHALASYRTPLHSDTLLPRDTERRCVASHHESTGRSARHDVQFRDVLHILRHSRNSAERVPVPSSSVPFQYISGSMTGLWEGTYKNYVSIPGVSTEAGNKPLEFTLAEFIRPVCDEVGVSEGQIDLWSDLPPELLQPKQDYSSLFIGGREYKRFAPSADYVSQNKDTRHDVILLGETTEAYSCAWGKSYFFGRVHSDGTITLRCHLKAIGGNYVLRGQVQSEIAITGHLRMGLPTLGGSMATQSAFSLRRFEA